MANTLPMPHPLDVKDPPKAPELMFACIERSKSSLTLCNRIIKEKEFTFGSSAAQHVVSHYDPRRMKRTPALHLTGCIACIDVAKEMLEKEGTSRLA